MGDRGAEVNDASPSSSDERTLSAITARFNLPVNREAASWSPDSPPADWRDKREQWHRGHAIRLPLALVAFACHSSAAIVE